MKRVSSFLGVLFVTSAFFVTHCGCSAEKKVEKKEEKKTAIVSIDTVQTWAGDSLDVPVFLENDEAIAGVQLKIQFDPRVLTIGKPVAAERSGDMLVMHNVKDNELLVMMYSMSGDSIASGNGPILMLPLSISGDAAGSSSLDLREVILAKRDAQTVSASSRSGKLVITRR